MAAQLAQTQNIAAAQSPEQRERLAKLKDDPELKDMFEDIQANGAGELTGSAGLCHLWQSSLCSSWQAAESALLDCSGHAALLE